jgi:hypothetical protein
MKGADVTIGSLLEGGFRLIKERPGAMLIWTLIQLAAAIGASYWMVAIIQGNIDALMSGASEQSVQTSSALQGLLVSLAGLVVSTIIYAAVQRAIIRPAEGGPGWLKLGMDEVRLFLLVLLYLIIFLIGMFIVLFVVGGFMAGAGPAAAWTIAIVLLAFGFLVVSYFGTKLSLTFPLTLKERAFAIGEGWNLTNGRFWTLYGAYFIIFLILLAIGLATTLALRPEYFSAVFRYGLNSPEAQMVSMQEYQELMSGSIGARTIIGWVVTAVQGTLGYALLGGAAATAVQQLTADEEGLSDTFS